MKLKKVLKSKIFWVIIVILAVIIVFIVRSTGTKNQPEYVTQKAEIGDIVQTVSATGQVKSASEIELNFKNTGTLSVLNVDTGDKVKAGDLLAQLKATDLGISINKAQADLQEAQANLAKVTAGATAEEIAVAAAAVEKSKTDLANTQADLASTEKTYQQTLENKEKDLLNDINSALTKANISLQKVYDTIYYEGDDDNFKTSNFGLVQTVLTDYNDALKDVASAQTAYDLAKANQTASNIDAAASLTLSALDLTETTLENLTTLFDYVILTATLTQTELDTLKTTTNTERTTTDTSINNVNSAKQDLSDARINYDTEVEAAQNDVAVAQRNLSKAEADLDLKKAAARPEDIALYEARVRRAQADLNLAQDKYAETILRAPIAGVITEKNVNVGEQTSLSKPVIRMLAVENYEIEVDIPESDIAKIELGDLSTITLDAFSDEEIFHGTVTTINPAQTEIQDVIYYKVTVSFAEQQPANVTALLEKVKPGMTADISIMTAKKQQVLVVPSRAIKEKNGDRLVEILQNGQVTELKVTTGLRGDDGLTEITSGLSAGQEVVTFVRNK